MEESKIEKYFSTEESFFNDLKKSLGDDLLFYCVTGSLARKEVIPEWSDIDTLIVCSDLDLKTLTNIKEAIDRNNSNIKIGITLYSLKEFNSYNSQDPKTYNVIRNILSNRYLPKIHNNRVILKKIDNKISNNLNRVEFLKDLHSFKRELIKYPDYSERNIYRFLTYMLRVLLFYKNIYCDGYIETWNEAGKVFTDLPFQKILPEDILHLVNDRQDRFLGYVNFLEWLNNEKRSGVHIN